LKNTGKGYSIKKIKSDVIFDLFEIDSQIKQHLQWRV